MVSWPLRPATLSRVAVLPAVEPQTVVVAEILVLEVSPGVGTSAGVARPLETIPTRDLKLVVFLRV